MTLAPFHNHDVVIFEEPDHHDHNRIVRQVAIRKDWGWKDGQWQVAIHGFRRIKDEEVRRLLVTGRGRLVGR